MEPYNIVVDVKRLSNYQTNKIEAKQGDSNSRIVEATITDDGVPLDLTGKTVTFYAEKPDNTTIYNDTTVIDATYGIVEFNLTTQALAVAGILKGELVVYGGTGEKLSSAVFNLIIKASVNNDSAIESTNEFTQLTKAITDISDLEANYAPQLQGLLSQFNDAIANVTVDSEVITARTSLATGIGYDTLALILEAIENRQLINNEITNEKYMLSFEVSEGQPRIRLEEVI